MPVNLTQNHLVLLLSENLPAQERLQLISEVNADWTLRESYRELKKAYASLVKVIKKPSAQSISNILAFSQNHMDAAQV